MSLGKLLFVDVLDCFCHQKIMELLKHLGLFEVFVVSVEALKHVKKTTSNMEMLKTFPMHFSSKMDTTLPHSKQIKALLQPRNPV